MATSAKKKIRQIRWELWDKQRGRCCYCKVLMYPHSPHPRSVTLEHLRRRADGGTNHRDNLALACSRCNSGRGNVDWFTYASRKQGEAI